MKFNSSFWAIVGGFFTVAYFALAIFMANNPGAVALPWYLLVAPGLIVATFGLGRVVHEMIAGD